MGNGSLSITKEYSDDKFFTEAILDGIKAEIEAHVNDVIKNNFDQLKADLFPSTYVFNDDGLATLTDALYNKQTATSTYFSDVNFGLTADADFTDADGTNLILTFTPELEGEYLVKMSFCLQVIPTAGNIASYKSYFRLTDSGVSPQTSTPKVVVMKPKVADGAFTIPITIEGIFTFTATSQTIKLQKKNVTMVDIGTHGATGSASNYGFDAMAIKL